jgi:hypothetical protein
MKFPSADLYDRYSIECLKKDRASADNTELIKELYAEISVRGYVKKFVDQLLVINGKIWDLESDIRKGKEGELGLEEVGRRAIAIRNHNAERIEIKNSIAKYFNEHGEKKYNHASIK